jgi:ATP-dependent Lhr-like helicase
MPKDKAARTAAGQPARISKAGRAKYSPASAPAKALLPTVFANWFKSRGWLPRAHQIALLEHAKTRRSTLLIAPTGAGKTLAGFLPSLVELSESKKAALKGSGLHTLYISPLKALSVDVARNLQAPIEEMGLKIKAETRTGDTSVSRRTRQRLKPPEILLTTPEWHSYWRTRMRLSCSPMSAP